LAHTRTQGQIYEIKSRIEHLLVPMAHSHSVYVSNLIRNYEVSAGPRSAAAETAPIKVTHAFTQHVYLYEHYVNCT
jgi:hypothetical protein